VFKWKLATETVVAVLEYDTIKSLLQHDGKVGLQQPQQLGGWIHLAEMCVASHKQVIPQCFQQDIAAAAAGFHIILQRGAYCVFCDSHVR
jgi:hypothetical protein